MVFTLVVGFAYTLLQIAFTIYQVCMGRRLSSGDGLYQFDFYGDKVQFAYIYYSHHIGKGLVPVSIRKKYCNISND